LGVEAGESRHFTKAVLTLQALTSPAEGKKQQQKRKGTGICIQNSSDSICNKLTAIMIHVSKKPIHMNYLQAFP